MKRLFSFIAFILIVASIYATTIVQISDIHYLSPSLFDYDRLRNLTLTGDGKATHIMDKVMDEFVSEMLELSPDAVVVTGDLTYNGEKKSHEELKDKLSILEKNGIKVFVLMGNHDTGNATPYALYKDKVVETEGITAMEAEELWMDFGYGEAVSKDPVSNSYMAEVSDNLWIMCIDSNNGSGGSVRSKTLTWIENALRVANIKEKKVITATHQNLFVHNPRYTFGYQINNSNKVVDILKKWGVKLNLSGHLHIQHITKESGITEIAQESFSDWPLQYGVIEIDVNGRYSYFTKEIGNKDLMDEAQFVFDSSTQYKFTNNIESENKDKMTEVATVLNREYFRGKVDDYNKDALALWDESYRMTSYLNLIANDTRDYRSVEGSL